MRMQPVWSLLFVFATSPAWGSIILTNASNSYSQNFDTLASTGTSSTLPADWAFFESGTNANTTYTAGTGSSNAGDTYSFGAVGSAERALGALLSNTLAPRFGVSFQNGGTSTLESLLIGYTGEEWRLGAVGGRTDRLDFQYSLDATSLTTGTWLDFNALDFVTPNTAGTSVGARNGHDPLFQTPLSSTLTSLNLGIGQTLWLRWLDSDVMPGADDGLGVDNFSVTANFAAAEAPAPSTFVMAAMGMLSLLGAQGARKYLSVHSVT